MLKILLKLVLAAGIIGWLVYSGKLDFTELVIYIDKPEIIVFSIFIFAFGFVYAQSLRWRLLLQGLGVNILAKVAMQLQMIGFFFNVAMPGAVGGDIIKAIYVSKHIGSRTKAMTSVLLDRTLGLLSLFTLTGIVSVLNIESLWAISALRPLVILIFVVLNSGFIFIGLVYWKRNSSIEELGVFKKKIPGMAIFKEIFSAFWAYRKSPRTLAYSLLIGMVIQTAFGMLFYYMTYLVNAELPPLGVFAVVFPFGVLISSIPLAPGGLGVGHIGFEKVFALGGISNGANIFNIIILGQLLLNLTGAVPYLLYKSQGDELGSMDSEISA